MSEDQGWVAERHWKRSSTCASGTCVEIALTPIGVHMRDNQGVDQVLTFPVADWASFVSGVCGMPEAGSEGPIRVSPSPDRVVVAHRDGGGELSFVRRDWEVFIAGVQAGEFNA